MNRDDRPAKSLALKNDVHVLGVMVEKRLEGNLKGTLVQMLPVICPKARPFLIFLTP